MFLKCLFPSFHPRPDTNVCDLGFFHSFDVAIGSDRPQDVRAWQERLLKEWDAYPPQKLIDIFETLPHIRQAIIHAGGNNNYRLPHKSGLNAMNIPKNRS